MEITCIVKFTVVWCKVPINMSKSMKKEEFNQMWRYVVQRGCTFLPLVIFVLWHSVRKLSVSLETPVSSWVVHVLLASNSCTFSFLRTQFLVVSCLNSFVIPWLKIVEEQWILLLQSHHYSEHVVMKYYCAKLCTLTVFVIKSIFRL